MLKTLILYLIALISMSLPSVHGLAQESQAAIGYRYGYAGAGFYDLHLINPEDSSQGEQIIALPIAGDDFVSHISASPNGQWVNFVIRRRNEGEQIRLFNVLTGEVREQRISGIFGDIEWSPDSRFLAINLRQNNHYSAYIYDLQTGLLNDIHVPINNVYTLSWLPDGTRLAVVATECFQASCQGEIDIIGIPNYDILLSIPLPFNEFSDVCDLVWSPDNHYLSFVFPCSEAGLNAYFSEVFTWDTTTQSIQKITAFTQDLDLTSLQNFDPYKFFQIYYDIIWYDSSHLLVGVSGGEFNGGIGYDSATVQVKTNVYHPDGNSAQISSAVLTNWTLNPTNNTVAFRSEERALYTDEHNILQLTNQSVSVQVAILNGNTLQVLYTQLVNGCDLNWSPDGVYLAYSPHDGLDAYACWRTPTERFNFLNQVNGQISQVPVSIDPSWSGWIAVASSSPTEKG